MQSSSVRRSSSHLSVSSVREGNRRSDSGVESMLVEQRPGTPGGGSIQSSGSNRSSGFSAADAVSEELVDLSEPDQGPQEKSISDPDISRQPSHKYPDSFSRDSPFRHPGLSAELSQKNLSPLPNNGSQRKHRNLSKVKLVLHPIVYPHYLLVNPP